jgi:hypothetical protein
MKFTLTRPNFEKVFEDHRKSNVLTGADADDTTTIKIPVFEDGNLEQALYWRKKFEDLIEIKQLNAQARFTNALLLLTGPAEEKWISARDAVLGNPPANVTNARFSQVMTRFIQRCGATNITAEDLRKFLMNVKKPLNMKFHDFKARIIELDYYLPYLPGPLNQRIGEASLFSTLKKSVPAWKEKFINAKVRSSVQTISDLTDYYEELEETEEKVQARRDRQNRNNQNRNNRSDRNQHHGRGRSENNNNNNNNNNDNNYHNRGENPNNSGNNRVHNRRNEYRNNNSNNNYRNNNNNRDQLN